MDIRTELELLREKDQINELPVTIKVVEITDEESPLSSGVIKIWFKGEVDGELQTELITTFNKIWNGASYKGVIFIEGWSQNLKFKVLEHL